MALPLIPVLVGGAAVLYTWWTAGSAREQMIQTATYATKIANDFAFVWNKKPPAAVWEDPIAIAKLQALWQELQATYKRFQVTLSPYVPAEDAGVFEKFRKKLLALDNSETLNVALKPFERQVQDIAKRFETVCPSCGKVATTLHEDDKPTSLLAIAVYGGLAFGAGYLALQTYKAFTHDSRYPKDQLPDYAGDE